MKRYPFCLNSRRWITIPFFLNLPKSCPYREEQDCQNEQCAYFKLRPATQYLKYIMLIFKPWLEGGKIIQEYEEKSGGNREVNHE